MFPESHDTRSRNNVSRKVIPNIYYTAREKVFTYISSGTTNLNGWPRKVVLLDIVKKSFKSYNFLNS